MSEAVPLPTGNQDPRFTLRYPHPLVEALDAEPRAAMLAAPETAMQWLRQGTYGQFKRGLSWLNAYLEGVPPERNNFAEKQTCTYIGTQPIAEDGVIGPGYITYIAPAQASRTDILHDTWDAMRRMDNPVLIGQLGCVVLAEGQFYPYANKRLARTVYSLGTRGYAGTPQDRWDYSIGVYNQDPQSQIDFSGLHARLAFGFTTGLSETIKCTAGTDDLPHDVEPTTPDAEVLYLPKEYATEAGYYLNEPDFNVPLALAYLSEHRYRPRQEYVSSEDAISADAILRDMEPQEWEMFRDLGFLHKESYMDSIIRAFADGDEGTYGMPIEYFIADFMPAPNATPRRIGSLATSPPFNGKRQ